MSAVETCLNIVLINVHLSLKKDLQKVLISLQKSLLFTWRIALVSQYSIKIKSLNKRHELIF